MRAPAAIEFGDPGDFAGLERLPSWPWAALEDFACPCPLERSAEVVPVGDLCWKIAPEPGDAGRDPDLAEGRVDARAMPLRSCGTTPMAVEASGGLTRPTPAPAEDERHDQ